jgi:hypothetical protein
MKKLLIGLILALLLALVPVIPALAATTVNISVYATPAIVAIGCDQSTYDFEVVAASATPHTAEDWATIDNTSTVQTDQTISVTTSTWAGGAGWAHSDNATPDLDTAGLLANQDGTWGVSDVIVKYASPDNIVTDQDPSEDYSFGLELLAPTSYTPTNFQQKSITVRITAAPG